MNTVYIGDPYAAVDAEYERSIDEAEQYEAWCDRVAAEILADTDLFDEACGEFDELRTAFIKATLKSRTWGARNDRAEMEAILKEIDGAALEIAWAYAPQIIDQRIKDEKEY